MKRVSVLIFAVVLLISSGCGSSSNTTNTTAYSLSQIASLTTGHSLSINVSGTDTQGNSYTGTFQQIVEGPTTLNGNSVTEQRTLLTLTEVNVGQVSVVELFYWNTNGTLNEILFTSGITGTCTNNFAYPSTVQIGESFAGASLSLSNGTTYTSNWTVSDGGNGNAELTLTGNTNTGLAEQDVWVITPAGTVVSYMQTTYNFPAAGVTTTLTGAPM